MFVVELSSKITKSVYLFLEGQGEIAGEMLESTGLSPEVALDPERWIRAEKVETFLENIKSALPEFSPKDAALLAPNLKGWGLLDQVLRIVQTPSEIYQQPEKFLSYFIRPDLPVEWVEKNENLSSFLVPISSEEFPLVAEYLSGALEAVALFSGSETARVSWNKHTILIDWAKKQESIFKDKEPVNFKPQIYKDVVEIVEKQQTELFHLRERLVEPSSSTPNVSSQEIVNELKSLQDYFLRSRQLVALLKAQSGEQKWFKEAVKRLNWDELQGLFKERTDLIEMKLKGEVKSQNIPRDQIKNSSPQENLRLNL